MFLSTPISRWCTAGALLLLGSSTTWAQTITPSNMLPDAAVSNTTVGLFLDATQVTTPSSTPIILSPFSSAAASNIPSAGTSAQAIFVNSTPVSNSLTNQVAFIQCDDNDASTIANIFTQVVSATPNAVVLFSTSTNYCSYVAGTFARQSYANIWTVTTQGGGRSVSLSFAQAREGRYTLYADIFPSSYLASHGGINNTSTVNTNSGQPSTAVAMIILYSITGVITALFLIIIVTGAIRAHRHPERYGPRNLLGRPRQSRARGLGRAILDTLPIVKFGEQEGEVKPGEGDMEMASQPMSERSRAGAATQTTPLNRGSTGTDDLQPASPGIEELPPGLTATKDESAENPGCSICTDDFEKGQDVRVLPCGHQFHPGCIDPWLLNVSGTCPLCRVDLRPETAQSNHTTTSNFIIGLAESNSESGSRRDSFAPPLGETTATTTSNNRSSRRMSGLIGSILNPRRMQDASREERIAALRRARDHRASQGEDEAEVRRSRRLTARLQDTFHIRTRASNTAGEVHGTPEVNGEEPVHTHANGAANAASEELAVAGAAAPGRQTTA